MGLIYSPITITNFLDPTKEVKCDALVDTGASYLTLPSAWKEKLGELELIDTFDIEIATQEKVKGELYGPVKVQLEGFRPVYTEVLFIDMQPTNGSYEPLVGYLLLEQVPIAIDMLSHRLLKGRAILK